MLAFHPKAMVIFRLGHAFSCLYCVLFFHRPSHFSRLFNAPNPSLICHTWGCFTFTFSLSISLCKSIYVFCTSLAEKRCVRCDFWLSNFEGICQGFNTHIHWLHSHSNQIFSPLLTDDYSLCCFIMHLSNLCVHVCFNSMTAVRGI